MDGLVLALMIGVLLFNAYGIVQVGIDHASTMQWVVTIVMLVFVLARIIRMSRK